MEGITKKIDFLISIDGPAGSGKSTICELIAKKLGFTHIDTGSMYRAVTYYAISNNLPLDDETSYDFIDQITFQLAGEKIYLNQKDISQEIRSKEVTDNVSLVSSFSSVRKKLVALQKELAHGKIIMDGRDIGTKVMPQADIKIFLTADSRVRAIRRLKQKNQEVNEERLRYEELNIIKRDNKDSTRKDSPLVVPKDALILDTSNSTLQEVVDKIISIIEEEYKI
ncbi:MAG: (d)CMP kinase [Acholeplasmatales bacterium]|nr:(d)CMP kinase [Acholeplasmatales bacterium]